MRAYKLVANLPKQKHKTNSLIYLGCMIAAFLQIALISNVKAQPQKPAEFRQLNVQNGLSNSWVRCMLKDSRGFMWFGTSNGLNRYDGVGMRIFKREFNDPESLASNTILSLCEDSKGDIWIGTQHGLSIFDRKKEKFHSFDTVAYQNAAPGLPISKIVIDKEDNVWLGSAKGLYFYNSKINKFTVFLNNPNDPNSLAEDFITDLEMDHAGALWIATKETGVDRFDRKNGRFTHFRSNLEDQGWSIDQTMSIHIDTNGGVWVGARRGGLHKYDKGKNKFERVVFDSNVKAIESDAFVLSILDDEEGRLIIGTFSGRVYISDPMKTTFYLYASANEKISNMKGSIIQSMLYDFQDKMLWIGTEDAGVNYASKWGKVFDHYRPGEGGLLHRTVFDVVEDDEGNIWVATQLGINVINKTTGEITHHVNNPNDRNTIDEGIVTTIQKDNAGTIWCGVFGDGLQFYDKANNRFIHLNGSHDSTMLAASNIYDIVVDNNGTMWLATDADRGLACYHVETRTFSTYAHIKTDPNSVRNNFVRQIVDGRDGNLYLLTLQSVQVFNKETHSFSRFMIDLEEKFESIQYLLFDSEDNVWLGTNNGLIWINKNRKEYLHFLERDGLPSGDIASMLEDNNRNLWVATKTGGLFKFENAVNNPRKAHVVTYSTIDGLQGNEFVSRAAYKSDNNTLYFCGQNGFNALNLNDVLGNRNPPPVVFTGLKIFNKEVSIGQNSHLQQSITESKTLTLTHEDYVFSLSFAALNYLSPEKNKYAYILENFESEWNYVDNEHTATYTNLSPGVYTFKVKASNNYGVWNEAGTSLTIIVKPPFWEEWWFRIVVSILIIGSVVTWFRRRTLNERRQKMLLEEKVRIRTKELQEANVLLTEQKETLNEQKEILNEQKETLKNQSNKIESLFMEVKDSIRAAETIQTSILREENIIKEHLHRSFILNKPKDVISGDFYWFDVIDNKIVIAVCDCTGHGVSGALMTINAYHLLNEAKHICSTLTPSEILCQLNILFMKNASRKNNLFEVSHGMDISLCVLDKNTNTLEFAAAKSKLFIVRNKEIIEIKGDPVYIGDAVKNVLPQFTNHTIQLQKDDRVYLFTDGYADQFGGENGTQKLMYRRFRNLLVEISSKNTEEHGELLNQFISDWRKDIEQTDDILVVGFQV